MSQVKYEHYKGGIYEVIGIAKEEATLKDVVVYVSIETEEMRTRPFDEFFGVVTTVSGTPVKRFLPIESKGELSHAHTS